MLMLKKISARTGLFRCGKVGHACPRPTRAEPPPRLSYADVRLSSLGLALERQGSFQEWLRTGR